MQEAMKVTGNVWFFECQPVCLLGFVDFMWGSKDQKEVLSKQIRQLQEDMQVPPRRQKVMYSTKYEVTDRNLNFTQIC